MTKKQSKKTYKNQSAIAIVNGIQISEKEFNDAMNDNDDFAVEKLERIVDLALASMPDELVQIAETTARTIDIILWWRKLALNENDFLTSDEYCEEVVGGIEVANIVKQYS